LDKCCKNSIPNLLGFMWRQRSLGPLGTHRPPWNVSRYRKPIRRVLDPLVVISDEQRRTATISHVSSGTADSRRDSIGASRCKPLEHDSLRGIVAWQQKAAI
jgi:hypothetical protein